MDKTRIDWADASWNPITGCLHGCEYCYARKMAHRYAGMDSGHSFNTVIDGCKEELHFVSEPARKNGMKTAYPFDFEPTFHQYRLQIPSHWVKPRTIFVGSMADVFGDWVPDSWIESVFSACKNAPQHRYMFLTKNQGRYKQLHDKGMLPIQDNFWYGTTYTFAWKEDIRIFVDTYYDKNASEWKKAVGINTFWSVEPFMPGKSWVSFKGIFNFIRPEWVIIGAETGNRKGKTMPERFQVESLREDCEQAGVPMFMKKSLREIMGDGFVQQYPWDAK